MMYSYLHVTCEMLFETITNTVTLGKFYVVFLVPWGRVKLSPLGTSATNWPIILAPDDT
jgi:hypothetical protein